MIAMFSAYIKTIVAFTIFSTLACMFMPESNFRKYLELVLGLLILSAVMTPIFNLFGLNQEQFTIDILPYDIPYEQTTFSNDTYQTMAREQLLYTYEQELTKQIKADLQIQLGNISEIAVVFCMDLGADTFGELENLVIYGESDCNQEELISYIAKRYELNENDVEICVE